MQQEFDWITVLINWFPLLLIFGVWFWFIRRMQGGNYSKYQKDCFELQKRQAEALERLAAALEKRAP